MSSVGHEQPFPGPQEQHLHLTQLLLKEKALNGGIEEGLARKASLERRPSAARRPSVGRRPSVEKRPIAHKSAPGDRVSSLDRSPSFGQRASLVRKGSAGRSRGKADPTGGAAYVGQTPTPKALHFTPTSNLSADSHSTPSTAMGVDVDANKRSSRNDCLRLPDDAGPVRDVLESPLTEPTSPETSTDDGAQVPEISVDGSGLPPTKLSSATGSTTPSSTASIATLRPASKPPTIRQNSAFAAAGAAASAPLRPQLNRYHSMPYAMSPLRQHFRLHSPHPHHVKETPSIAFSEDARGRFINQYQIVRVLGRGSFGVVYLAVDETGQQFALKECSKRRLAKQNRAALMRLRRQLLAQAAPQSASSASQSAPSASSTYLSVAGPTDPSAVNALITHEIAIMKKLDHPNLVALHEVLDNPASESLILVIEWCPGGTIMSADAPQPLAQEQCRLYFRDVLLGVEYLHSRGVCHRDIKADNVLLGAGDVAKISDFGVSEIFDLHDDRSDVFVRPVGSPAYMSPELVLLNSQPGVSAAGDSRSGPSAQDAGATNRASPLGVHSLRTTPRRAASASGRRADIWAMGVTLYFMATGRLPFRGDTLEDLQLAILTTEPDYTGLSASLVDLLARIFVKDPAARIALRDMRTHPWVTQNGADPLLSESENVETSAADTITEEDLLDAIAVIGSPAINYVAVTQHLRANHGWHAPSSSECSSGVRTPRTEGSSTENSHTFASPKMEKLTLALEELQSYLRVQERDRRHDSV